MNYLPAIGILLMIFAIVIWKIADRMGKTTTKLGEDTDHLVDQFKIYRINLDDFKDHPIYQREVTRCEPKGSYYAGGSDKGHFKTLIWSLYRYRFYDFDKYSILKEQPWFVDPHTFEANGYRITCKVSTFMSNAVIVELINDDGSILEVKDPGYQVEYTEELAEIFGVAVQVMAAIYAMQYDIVESLVAARQERKRADKLAEERSQDQFISEWKS